MLVDFWRLSNAYSQYLDVNLVHPRLDGTVKPQSLESDTSAVLQKLIEMFGLIKL